MNPKRVLLLFFYTNTLLLLDVKRLIFKNVLELHRTKYMEVRTR